MEKPSCQELPDSDVSDAPGISSLIVAARQRSDSGLGELLEAFRPELMKMAENRVGAALRRRMSLSDLVQDTMLTAGQQFAAFRGKSEPELRAWLLELFQSRLMDGLRKHRQAEIRRQQKEGGDVTVDVADPAATPSELAVLNEDAQRLQLALLELPEEMQRIIRLRYLEDRTFEQIASHLQCSVPTVWRRWRDAVRWLQEKVSK